MTLGAHPRKVELGAWFDGEGSDRTGTHVARCGRCQRNVAELGRLRSWLRSQPFVAMSDTRPAPAAPSAARRARKPVLVAASLVATFLVVADRSDNPEPLTSAAPATTTTTIGGNPATSFEPSEAPSPVAAIPPEIGVVTPPSTRPVPVTSLSVSDQALAAARETLVPGPLRLGLVVPTSGAMAAEGNEVVNVVRQRVAAANAAGGVAGLPVELEVAPAEDPARVAVMTKRVSALVGGWGTVATQSDTPWLLPADPSITGPSVLPAEMPARTAGVQLATILRRLGIDGPVGVVVGSGPDAALAPGLSTKVQTVTAVADEAGTCEAEVRLLRKAGAAALAIAGNPELAARCMRAAFRLPWLPPYGVVLAPSAAYAGLQSMPEALGARTVLGLPWPTSTAPGAARFRATSNSTSYRALVSYAATELAIDVARQQGAISLDSVGAGVWRNDLIDLTGLTNRVNTIVVAILGTWLIIG